MRILLCLQTYFLAVILISSSGSAIVRPFLSNETYEGDPHSCFWFEDSDDTRVYRCCDGYYKPKKADAMYSCVECPDGSYGMFCDGTCTCINSGTCNKIDGSCRCPENFFGKTCEYACNCENGATCMSDGSCSCTVGFYGPLCEFKCSCPPNKICHGGKCVCHDGFYGDNCLPCACNKRELCDPLNGCTCKEGFFGKRCRQYCPCINGGRCTSDNSECECGENWLGENCTDCNIDKVSITGQKYCEKKCLHCYNGNKCSVAYGDCKCTPGWRGKRCHKKCREGFYGKDCLNQCRCTNGNCHHITGKCHCHIGWTGHQCEHPCPENCVICKTNVCTSCKPGWVGVSCNIPCDPGFYGDGCKQKCEEVKCINACHHIDGSCSNLHGFNNSCKCRNGGRCVGESPMCECADGWTGEFCEFQRTTSEAATEAIPATVIDEHVPNVDTTRQRSATSSDDSTNSHDALNENKAINYWIMFTFIGSVLMAVNSVIDIGTYNDLVSNITNSSLTDVDRKTQRGAEL